MKTPQPTAAVPPAPPSPAPSWHDRLHAAIPWGSSTCSKAPRLRPEEPDVIVRGEGCRVWDDRGREFIDYRNALGPVTLGYRFPAVDAAIRAQLDSGIIFGHPHPLEAEVAEMLCAAIPCAEQARFLKTGGEAIAACIRAARAYTNRPHVIHIGYNGWLNGLAPTGAVLPGQSSAGHSPPGVPDQLSALHHACPWNDIAAVEQAFASLPGAPSGGVAAVVVAADYADIAAGATFYPQLRELTRRHGSVLIFDEIVTGFRIALAGVQQYFNVVPDMAVFAKGMANGMPLSAYAGRRDLMDTFHRAIVSSTYGGDALALAASRATLRTYLDHDVVGHLWRTGASLWPRVNDLCRAANLPITLTGFWPCPTWRFTPSDPARRQPLTDAFFRACYRHGLSLYQVSYVNFSHQATDIDTTLERFARVVADVVSAPAP